jgi:uracil phosphoribosyltransferase
MNIPALHVSQHPLVKAKVAKLRDQSTTTREFRELVASLAELLFVEASQDLPTMPLMVQTPLALCEGAQIGCQVGIIPILRAGLGMADAILHVLPDARVWHLGLYRDHDTHQPIWYYDKLPDVPNIEIAYIVDPMLATGGSVIAAVDRLKKWGVTKIKFLGLIAAPEGLQALQQAHPDVAVYLAALDSHLNPQRYIVPGLGDAGDRQFGTR